MAKRFLITRPTHDVITSYLHDFSNEIVKTVKGARDIHVTDLEGPVNPHVGWQAPGKRKAYGGDSGHNLLNFNPPARKNI